MINKYMWATPHKESTREDCGQEARRLLKEVRRIVYELEMEMMQPENMKLEMFRRGSEDLKNFIVEKIGKDEGYENLLVRLEKIVEEQEMECKKEEEMMKMTKILYEQFESRMKAEREEARRNIKCYNCGRLGHTKRWCRFDSGRQEANGINENTYVYDKSTPYNVRIESCPKNDDEESSSSDRKIFVSQEEGKRMKKNTEDIKRYKSVYNRKRQLFGKSAEDYQDFTRSEMEFEKIKEEFSDVLDLKETKIQFCNVEKCKIKTEDGKKIVRKGQTIPQALIHDTEKYIADLERRGIIRRSFSEWRNPIRAIQKPDGSVRLVSNLMALNDITEKDPYELCNIRDVIRSTQGSKFFTVIDLKEGFYSIEIEEEDKYKTAFEFNKKVFEWNSMVMGYKNSPQILQRVMNRIFEKFIGRGIEIYMDDIVIHSKTKLGHDELVSKALQILRENNMRVNNKKIQYCQGEVKLLGVTLNGEVITPSEIKQNEALDFPKPQNISDVRKFLGVTGWFRNFIKDYSTHTINLTDSLKGKGNNWKWTVEMDKEFEGLKDILRSLGKLRIVNYEKEFLLRTDASNVGMGAVLMQRNEGKEWVPVQWASKKFTPTETRYGISEKEMYAVFWGIKKFEYELRGRRFKVETDHKALVEIRRKPSFNNNRINRWIEKIQEFDFTIEYKKPEIMVVADALSRVHSMEETKDEMNKRRSVKQNEGKWEKHVENIEGKMMWRFDSGRIAEIPEENQREELIFKYHENLGHRSLGAVYYAMKFDYYWPGIKKDIEETLRRCERCQIYNRKKSGGCDFVETTGYLEKVALDLIEFRDIGKYVLVAVDYHTRFVWGIVLSTKTGQSITTFIKDLCLSGNRPQEIITDNGKEFNNEEFRNLCCTMDISHRRVSIESHRSNGRVERVIGTLRETILKLKNGDFEEKVATSIRIYNKSYHSGLGCTPLEALSDETGHIMIENGSEGKYSKRFVRRKREIFKKGQQVRISKSENLKGCNKYEKGRFLEIGIIVEVCGGDSYIVKLENGRLVKKRHYDLKYLLRKESKGD